MALHVDVATSGDPCTEPARPSFTANGAAHIRSVPIPVHGHGEAACEALRWGSSIVLEHHPAGLVEATSETDIIVAIELATRDVRRASKPQDFARLQELKAMYDPKNLVGVDFNIPAGHLHEEVN
jgi:hypothetical protein